MLIGAYSVLAARNHTDRLTILGHPTPDRATRSLATPRPARAATWPPEQVVR